MAPTWSVDSILESDVAQLQELFESAGRFVRARGASDYWLYARLFRDTCLAARTEDKLVGALIAFRDQTRDFREVYVQDVAVAAGWRGRGIGQALMSELITRAESWKGKRIWLTSEAENQVAMRLWNRLGFVNDRADYLDGDLWVTRNLKGPGKDRVVFTLDLQSSV